MNMVTTNAGRNSKVAIVGAGPAGASLAIRLASRGFDVTLIERERFPRHKLCGEFISPECLRHFAELGLGDEMLSAGGERIYETRFYDRRGRSFAVPSGLLDGDGFALSLSRFEMDRCLMDRAKALGVAVFEGAKVSGIMTGDGRISGIEIADDDRRHRLIEADLFVDATGRAMALSKIVERTLRTDPHKTSAQPSIAVGFKTHFRGARIAPGTCEIFSFPGGYGGLTPIEGGLANLCFIMEARAARRIGGGPDKLVREAVSRNTRAAWCLENATPARDWLAVSINSFGRPRQADAENLLSVGDAAAFIDPFTGSGMLMALESSALLAHAIAAAPGFVRETYSAAYDKAFARRLRICSILRRAAFLPVLPTLMISFLNLSRHGRNYLAAATRSSRAAQSKIG
jgi:flavin-dependent dehydrogenase